MVTYFNKGDAISFGQYLLSKEREESLKQTNVEVPNSLPYEEREVYDADWANWLHLRGKTTPPPDMD